ncbi:hypothetical protein N474_20115 [Pseudoalteromonas luteoviolacea CPMOR-2]|nr:hypothetical protein [Pseudoalteromonas luteoviolacea]KZN53640.1 hypothetical protein N474_20115 [Pseudoalteromonas luteoviolacea CPMOR-2]
MILLKNKLAPSLLLIQLVSACGNNNQITEPNIHYDTVKKVDTNFSHHYPAPTGDFRVGVKELDIQSYHEDIVSPNFGELRNLHIKIFYPSHTQSTKYQAYFNKWGDQQSYLESMRPANAPIHPEQHLLSDMLSWSVANAPVALNENVGWPILYYSHGLGLFEIDNTELLESLASHGFVVVAINHTYLSGVTTFDSGKTAHLYLPEGKQDVTMPAGRVYFDNTVALQIGQDVTTVHEWLLWNQWSLEDQVNLHNVGTLGFSLGGSAAMNGCQQLDNCKAAANMDGIVLGHVAKSPLNKPLLLLSADQPFAQLDKVFEANQATTHMVTIAGSEHNDFTDQNRWIIGTATAIEADKIHRVVKQSMVRFFKANLENQTFTLPKEEGIKVLSK